MQFENPFAVFSRSNALRLAAEHRFDIGAFTLDLKHGLRSVPALRSGVDEERSLKIQIVRGKQQGLAVRYGFSPGVQNHVQQIDSLRRQRRHLFDRSQCYASKELTLAGKKLFDAIIDVQAVADVLTLLREEARALDQDSSVEEMQGLLDVELRMKLTRLREHLASSPDASTIRGLLMSGDAMMIRIGIQAVTPSSAAGLTDALLAVWKDRHLPVDLRRYAFSRLPALFD